MTNIKQEMYGVPLSNTTQCSIICFVGAVCFFALELKFHVFQGLA